MKSDCYPISPTCTPPPATTESAEKKKPAYIGQQTEASSPESLHGQDKQQQPSALLSPSSSSGASFTEEEEHASPGKGLTAKKVNGDAKSPPKSDSHASDQHASDSESSLNSLNQSQKTQNSKLTEESRDELHSIRLKHLAHQRSLRNRGEDYDSTQDCDKSHDKTYDKTAEQQNGHQPSKAESAECNEETKSEKSNGNDAGYFLPSKRRTRDLKEENRLADEEGGREKNDNESDEFDVQKDELKEELKDDPKSELKDELKDEEEELFNQQFRNHFKKRHLIVAENGSKPVSSWKDATKSEPDKELSVADKPSDSPVDYSSGRPADNNLYSIYKQFYENYFTQHLNYMNGDLNVDLKSEPKSDQESETPKNGDPIDLKKRDVHRPNGDYPPFVPSLATDSVLNGNLEKYSAANHEGTLDGSRLKSMLYTHKLPESMDTIANYLNYYNLNGTGSFDGLGKLNGNGFGKPPTEFDSYRKHYGSLLTNQLKNGPDAVKSEPTKPGGLLSSALNPTNLSNKLMVPPDGQLLSKSLSRSLNGEKLNGNLMAGSLNGGSLHSSPTSSLFSQASPPINFLNYPRPPGQAMKPNSYHQFLCNLHQQQSTKVAQSTNDVSISNLGNTAAVGGALSSSRRKYSL